MFAKVAAHVEWLRRMQPLAEPLLHDAAPEPPANTARLLLTSHVLTKFGSKAWEVPQPTQAHVSTC